MGVPLTTKKLSQKADGLYLLGRGTGYFVMKEEGWSFPPLSLKRKRVKIVSSRLAIFGVEERKIDPFP